MSETRTYLDYNASAPLRPEARDAMAAAMDVCGNPSSAHAEGRKARALVEAARDEVARLVGVGPTQVVFTSGATEACNGVLRRSWQRIVYSRLEHAAVLAPVLASGGRLVEVGATPDGVIDLTSLARALDGQSESQGATLVALQYANNETGAIQPVAEAVRLARAAGALVLADAVQAAGRIALDLAEDGVDFAALSAHKLGGPKGVGALILGAGAPLPPWQIGGGQERRMRAGTENVVGIAGFGAAAAAALRDLAQWAAASVRRARLEALLLEATPDAVILASGAPRLPNTICIALPGESAETLLIKLDMRGFAISAGPACSSGKLLRSEVLSAMGVPDHVAKAAIRISLGPDTTDAEIAAFAAAWADINRARSSRRQVA